jgi:hypothetical protein
MIVSDEQTAATATRRVRPDLYQLPKNGNIIAIE